MLRFLAAALVTASLVLVGASGGGARAAEITVTSTAGTSGSPDCTLRDALRAANSDAPSGGCPAGDGADTIILAAGATYTLTEVDNTGVQNGPASPTPTATAAAPTPAPPRFVDNGDGTVTDRQTGLMWEQKTGTFDPFTPGVDCSVAPCSDPHNVNNHYAWSATGTAPDGGAFTDFLPRVNGTLCSASPCTGLAGHSDWRLPTIWELHAILGVDPAAPGCVPGSLCIDEAFGPTAFDPYWSATGDAGNPAWAWVVQFLGGLGAAVKTDPHTFYVRAVRGTMHAPEIPATSAPGTSDRLSCTLCDAITAVKTSLPVGGCPPSAGADTIILIAGVQYTLAQLDSEVTACTSTPQSNGLPSVTSDITIIGNGATIARSAAPDTPAFRLLHVAPGGRLTITDLTLTNGKMPDIPTTQPRPGGDGGGVLNEGVLTLNNTTVTGNSAGNTPWDGAWTNPLAGCAGRGGGVFNAGTLTLTGGSMSFNHAGSNAPGDLGGKCAGAGGGTYNDTIGRVTLNGTTVNGNVAGDDNDSAGAAGGGIFNAGDLVVIRSVLTGNAAGRSHEDYGGNGGALANAGSALLADSTVANNAAGVGETIGGGGGGVFNSGILTLTRCTVSGNVAGYGTGDGSGGGIANAASGSLMLVNSTVSGNQAAGGDNSPGDGGGVFNAGTMLLANCTISGNSAGANGYGGPDGSGGGIATTGALAILRNTLIAGNSTGKDCSGTLTAQSDSLIQDISNCTVAGSVITGLDPDLGPLQDNGGPTQTQALLPGSPAIDAGNPNGCTDADGNVLATDQRGAPRAVSGDERCDIGAYEATSLTTITPTARPAFTPTATAHAPTVAPAGNGGCSLAKERDTNNGRLLPLLPFAGLVAYRRLLLALHPAR